MVYRRLVRCPVSDDVNHVVYPTPHGALRASAIPPATQVAGFLAEVL
jgi:hypothetical protein